MLLDQFDHDGRFGCIDSKVLADFNGYAKGLTYTPFSDSAIAINERLAKYIRANKFRDRYKRLRDTDLRCMRDRLIGFVPNYGYLRAGDKRSWEYLIDLRNCLISEVDAVDHDNVNLLLVNYAKRMVHVAEMDENEQNRVDKRYYDVTAMHAFRDAFAICSAASNRVLSDNEVHLPNKKTTSLGFPFETVDGLPVTNEMLKRFVREDDKDFGRSTKSDRFVKDWSDIKNEWRCDFERGCAHIFETQMKFIEAGGVVDASNVCELMEHNLISVHTCAQRENCAKAPQDVPRVVKITDKIYTSDRNFAAYELRDGIVVGRYDGILDIHRYTDLVDAETGMFGGVNRNRRISPSNNVMHTMGTLYAQCALYHTEHNNAKGNPSPRPIINDDVVNFYQRMVGKGYIVGVVDTDCVNAEVTVATEHELFNELTPVELLEWYNLTACSVVPYKNSWRFKPGNYCSAVWYTTWKHVLKGNFEMCRLVHYLAKENGYKPRPLADICRDVVYILMLNRNVPELSALAQKMCSEYVDRETWSVRICEDFYVNPKLGTDDVVWHCATKKRLVMTKQFSNMLDATKMTFGVTYDAPVIAFGSRIHAEKVEISEGSKLSKIHWNEHLGFSLKDGFSTYAKIIGSGYESVFDRCLKKHFGASVSDYAIFADGFYSWLQARGVGLDEVFNTYSPHEQMVLDAFLAKRYGYDIAGVKKDDVGHEWAIVASKDVTHRSAAMDETVIHGLRALLTPFWCK